MTSTLKANALGALLLFLAFATSCIKPEAPNAEADIVSVKLANEIAQIRPAEITNNTVTFYVNAWNIAPEMAPEFVLTEGATIVPASGTMLDFSKPQTYTVTSQDGLWSKEYTVMVQAPQVVSKYTMDHHRKVKNYHELYEPIGNGGEEVKWASGNAGAKMVLGSAGAESYPTSFSPNGYKNGCAKLTTISTGFLGSISGRPIAAGNLFLGTFDSSNLLKEALTLTHFGVPYHNEPEMLIGYYKYQAGSKMTNGTAGEKDMFDLYAVLFEVGDGVTYLDGTNVLTSDRVVLKAQITDPHETAEWTEFRLPFRPQNGKTIDKQKLKEGGYSLSIVATSSKEGVLSRGL